MSASVCFEYGGYHFFPLRRFAKGEGDFFALSKRLESDPSVGLSEYKERQKFPYSYDDFYKAATNPNYDIFCCVENGKSYVPATRELFFDMQRIDNRRFMFNPKTGVLLLGVQYKPSKKIYGSHAEDLANARIYCGFDDYVRGWVGTGKDYPHGVIHFAPNVDDRNAALYDRAFKTLEMFSQNGAEAQTVVRALGKRWEQPLFSVLTDLKPEQKSTRHNQPTKKKEAEI